MQELAIEAQMAEEREAEIESRIATQQKAVDDLKAKAAAVEPKPEVVRSVASVKKFIFICTTSFRIPPNGEDGSGFDQRSDIEKDELLLQGFPKGEEHEGQDCRVRS